MARVRPMRVAVTGAFGYSGKYIAQRLLQEGHEVMTLTNSLHRPNPFGARVTAEPFNFDHPERLMQTLSGVEVLINTYWVRFDHRLFNHTQAVANTRLLFQAAKRAGVRRVVHVSITRPDPQSPLPYFRGKAELEADLHGLGLPYAILRPTVLFGREDVLINNMAWGLRHLPFFTVFGDGRYRLQPIYVDDLASLAVTHAAMDGNQVVDAIGPETYTYRGLVEKIAEGLAIKPRIISCPPGWAYWGCRLLGWLKHDVVITREEIRGLMEERLYVDSPPAGHTRLSDWIQANRLTLGRKYTGELIRRTARGRPYGFN